MATHMSAGCTHELIGGNAVGLICLVRLELVVVDDLNLLDHGLEFFKAEGHDGLGQIGQEPHECTR